MWKFLAALITSIVFVAASCAVREHTELGRINSRSAHTGYYLIDQTRMNRLAAHADAGPGPGNIIGLCCNDKSAIFEVDGESNGDTPLHEFCHLIDDYHGDYHQAFLSITGPGFDVPEEFTARYLAIRTFVDLLDQMPAFMRHRPYAQWALLQALYPGADVIQHPAIIRGLAEYWPDGL